MKKIILALVTFTFAGVFAPVMADPGKNESGHGKHMMSVKIAIKTKAMRRSLAMVILC